MHRRYTRTRLGQANVAPVDRFTLGHGAMGLMLGLWGMPWYWALISGIGFEVAEIGLKRIAPGVFPVGTQDTWANATFDTGAWMAGWAAGKAIPGEGARMWR